MVPKGDGNLAWRRGLKAGPATVFRMCINMLGKFT